MKTIELLIDEDQELAGITAVSLVAFPAIEENFVYFNQGEKYVLAAVDDDKRMLVGPALIPDKMIPRINNETGEEYEVFFSPETIAQASQLYMKEERTNSHTYEHAIDVDGVTVVESWLIADPEYDKSKLYGFDLPAGTWMLAMKVHNEEVWQAVKDKDVRGFSIEGYFVDQLVEANSVDVRKPCSRCPKDRAVLGAIRELVMEEMSAVAVLDGQPLFATPEEAQLYGELFNECVGIHEHVLDGKTLFMPCATHPEKLARIENLESYADYPDSVKNNAKRGIRKNERGGNKCGTQTGKVRAQQLADGEAISVETIKRMYSFLSRHERNYDPNDSTSCGTISYLLWGGKAALGWSRNKLRELGELD